MARFTDWRQDCFGDTSWAVAEGYVFSHFSPQPHTDCGPHPILCPVGNRMLRPFSARWTVYDPLTAPTDLFVKKARSCSSFL